jgi:hypothetical protein
MSEDNDTSCLISETSIISIMGILAGCFAGCLTYMLKSRCVRIKCGCLELERDVIPSNNINNNI